MRRILALVLTLVLLCGCTAAPPETTASTNPSPMAGGENVGVSGNLWYLPNEAVEAMEVTALRAMEDGLLVVENGDGTTLKKLSEEDLALAAEAALEGSRAYVQAADGVVRVADMEHDSLVTLSETLEVLSTRSVKMEEDTWMPGLDGGTIYGFSDRGALTAYDPETGAEEELLSTRMLSVITMTQQVVTMSYFGTEDLLQRWCELDLSTGTLTEPAGSRLAALEESLRPLQTGHYLEVEDRTLRLYDTEGGFVSACTLPGGEEDRVCHDLVWSDRWQGYFFIDHYEGVSRLMFWDPAVETEGEDVDITPETAPVGEILEQELYDRAAELSARFDLDIRIADRCGRDYKSYNSDMLTDPAVIANVLDVLEATLAKYPEGFFTQLKYSNVKTVRIEIVDDLAGKSGADVSAGTSAFSQKRDGYYLVVINGERIQESVLFHEFSHIIDKRIIWDAKLRKDALFSEEGWMALQPEGFEYAGSYQNIPDSVKVYYDSGYFVREYSCVSASEDRAMTLEKAMVGEREVFNANPGLIPKLEYYCACIRDSFDTEGWPEVTLWEQLLN